MFDDEYGNKVSTNSAKAVDLYNKGTHQFLGAEPGVEKAQICDRSDPEFALAYIGYAREMQLSGRSTDMSALEKAIKYAGNLTEREQSHLNVSSLLLGGKSAKARLAVYEHVRLGHAMCSSHKCAPVFLV